MIETLADCSHLRIPAKVSVQSNRNWIRRIKVTLLPIGCPRNGTRPQDPVTDCPDSARSSGTSAICPSGQPQPTLNSLPSQWHRVVSISTSRFRAEPQHPRTTGIQLVHERQLAATGLPGELVDTDSGNALQSRPLATGAHGHGHDSMFDVSDDVRSALPQVVLGPAQ